MTKLRCFLILLYSGKMCIDINYLGLRENLKTMGPITALTTGKTVVVDINNCHNGFMHFLTMGKNLVIELQEWFSAIVIGGFYNG